MPPIRYIDIFKGICIILVIVHHVPFVIDNSIPNKSIIGIEWIQNMMVGFFMPAFFIATGYCSNFSTSFSRFIFKNIKTILLPSFILYYFNHKLGLLNVFCFSDSSYITPSLFFSLGLRTYIREGGYYWFLSALFISKFIYFIIKKCISNRQILFIASLTMSLLGVIGNSFMPQVNFFFWQHALVLLIFLNIGEYFKKHENKITSIGWKCFFTYFILITLITILGYEIPSITRTFNVTLITYPIFLLFAFMGSLGIWKISKTINQCKAIEFLGRKTIVIYAFNYVISVISVNTLLCIVTPTDDVSVTCFFFVIITIDILLLSLLSYLFDNKYGQIILGKY